MRLSHRDFARLEIALGKLYEATSVRTLHHRVMEVAAGLIGNTWVSYNETASIGSGGGLSLSEPHAPSDHLSLYPLLYTLWHEHPVLTTDPSRRSIALSFADCLPRRKVERLALYNEYYRKVGTADQLVLMLGIRPGVTMRCVSISRDRAGFAERDRVLLSLLRPHFERAHRNASLFEDLNAGRALLAIDPNGCIEYMTDDAAQRLHSAFGSGYREGAHAPILLREWLRAQLPGAASYFEPLHLPVRHGLVSLRVAHRTESRTVVLLEKSAGYADDGWPRLTPREREVIAWIAHGKSNPEIGIILELRPRTVEKHVENILAKLSLENRATLMLAALERGFRPADAPPQPGSHST